MKFMIMIFPKPYNDGTAKSDFKPDLKDMEPMGRFNDEVATSVTIEALNGLRPMVDGTRLVFGGGKPTVTDGPFIEAKEVVGGYWIVEAASKAEVVKLWQRCPANPGDVIDIRPIFDLADVRK
jgi:hypothetical protein